VIYSIVLPIVLYPTMLWAMFAGLSFIRGQSERLPSRVAAVSIPPAHQELADKLKAHKRVSFTHWFEGREAAIQSIAEDDLDVLMEFTEASTDSADLKDNFRVQLSFNQARDRSTTAKERVEKVLSSYRYEWLDRERKRLALSDRDWVGFRIQMENIATREDSGRFILSLMAPILIILIVGLAAFYPAIDATAGERERSTWETLMTVAAPRSTIALAKYLYVFTFGLAGGLLNLTALALSTQWLLRSLAGSAADKLFSTGIPWSGFPVIAIGTVLVSLFVAAIMLVLAAFARNFKEGQSMITPFYMTLIIPVLFLQSPNLEFTVQWHCTSAAPRWT